MAFGAILGQSGGGGQDYQIGDTILTANRMDDPNWLLCDGGLISKDDYPELYNLLPHKPSHDDSTAYLHGPFTNFQAAGDNYVFPNVYGEETENGNLYCAHNAYSTDMNTWSPYIQGASAYSYNFLARFSETETFLYSDSGGIQIYYAPTIPCQIGSLVPLCGITITGTSYNLTSIKLKKFTRSDGSVIYCGNANTMNTDFDITYQGNTMYSNRIYFFGGTLLAQNSWGIGQRNYTGSLTSSSSLTPIVFPVTNPMFNGSTDAIFMVQQQREKCIDTGYVFPTVFYDDSNSTTMLSYSGWGNTTGSFSYNDSDYSLSIVPTPMMSSISGSVYGCTDDNGENFVIITGMYRTTTESGEQLVFSQDSLSTAYVSIIYGKLGTNDTIHANRYIKYVFRKIIGINYSHGLFYFWTGNNTNPYDVRIYYTDDLSKQSWDMIEVLPDNANTPLGYYSSVYWDGNQFYIAGGTGDIFTWPTNSVFVAGYTAEGAILPNSPGGGLYRYIKAL